MKYKNTEKIIKNYYSVEEKNVDEKELLRKLRPAIISKCERLNSKKRNIYESTMFMTCQVLGIFIGLIFLFPEFIDYTDELIQFGASTLVLVALMVGFLYTFMTLLIGPKIRIRRS